MEYFVYCRDHPDTAAERDRLVEAHWSFMDTYAATMIARGPTMDGTRTFATGSMHMVGLPDAAAARVFAFEEPNYRAGIYREVMIRRYHNELGRTMWDFTSPMPAGQRFLVIAHADPGATSTWTSLHDKHNHSLADHESHLIGHGPLLSEDGTRWTGTAILVELPDRAAVEDLISASPLAGLYATVEIHNWQFGGRD